MKTREMQIYDATEQAKNAAVKIVPKGLSKNYPTSCACFRYIVGEKKIVPKLTKLQREKLESAKMKYNEAISV